jgi:hypothetical protein
MKAPTFTATLFRVSNGWFARSSPRQQIAWLVCASLRQRSGFRGGLSVRLRPTGCGNYAEYMGRAKA